MPALDTRAAIDKRADPVIAMAKIAADEHFTPPESQEESAGCGLGAETVFKWGMQVGHGSFLLNACALMETYCTTTTV